MSQKMNCKKCGKETEVQMRDDGKTGGHVFNCQHCGALHVEESRTSPPGAGAFLTFKLADDA